MKIQILSDLHLEFSDRHPPFSPPDCGADVVVIAGDIDNGTRAIDWAERVFAQHPVIYVPGNHEYYGSELSRVAHALRERAARSANVRLLDNDETQIDGVRFLGSTLWTDFELFGRERIDAAFADSLRHVVDFRAIRSDRGTLLTPQDTIELHRTARDFLERCLAESFGGPTVVITHHAPHTGSLHPRWATHLSSAAFVSDLGDLMGKPALWIHGHTHDGFDYTVNGTRVIANPMGYRTSNWWESRLSREEVRVTYENATFDAGMIMMV